VDDPGLKYQFLARFDREMIALIDDSGLLAAGAPELLWEHDDDKILAFMRGGWIFAFNFHPHRSFPDYGIPAPAGIYRMILNTDDAHFGGHGRLTPDQRHATRADDTQSQGARLYLYLPSRTGLILQPSVLKGAS
jgi:1,4-alpha-glucan branching enzyme